MILENQKYKFKTHKREEKIRNDGPKFLGHDQLLEIRLLEKSARHDFAIYSTAFEQTIKIISISQQPYLTGLDVGSTGFEQLILLLSTAQTVDHLTFEQLTLIVDRYKFCSNCN